MSTDQELADRRQHYVDNRDHIKSKNDAWRETNREHYNEYHRRYRQEKKHKTDAAVREWRKNNPDKWSAIRHNNNIKRNKLIARQIISTFYTEQLVEIYRLCPDNHHVDHMVPLRGKNVCGLHVPWNLQYLPALVNLSKGNSLVL